MAWSGLGPKIRTTSPTSATAATCTGHGLLTTGRGLYCWPATPTLLHFLFDIIFCLLDPIAEMEQMHSEVKSIFEINTDTKN